MTVLSPVTTHQFGSRSRSLPRLKGVRDSSEKSGAERRSPVVSENEFVIFDLSLVSTKAALQWSGSGRDVDLARNWALNLKVISKRLTPWISPSLRLGAPAHLCDLRALCVMLFF